MTLLFVEDELENVQYSVDILDVPVSYGDKGVRVLVVQLYFSLLDIHSLVIKRI